MHALAKRLPDQGEASKQSSRHEALKADLLRYLELKKMCPTES